MMQLTHAGAVPAAAISPDGTRIAFVDREKEDYSLHLCQADGSHCRRLMHGTGFIRKMVFSPDGEEVFIGSDGGPFPGPAIFRISVAGGTPQAVVNGSAWLREITADGRSVLFLQATEKDDALLFSNLGTGERRTMARRYRPDRLTAASISPDGARIACWWLIAQAQSAHYQLTMIRVADQTEDAGSFERWPIAYPGPT